MWLLRKITGEETLQYLTSDKKCYTVGRKNSEIILNDPSISRTHCEVHIEDKNGSPLSISTPTRILIVDKKSKYGTYIQRNKEWVRISEEIREVLSDGSVIRFGLMENIWRLEYKPVIVCTSRLSNDQTKELRSLLTFVDGKIANKWVKQCSMVLVNDITLTAKVLFALINGVPIVTYNYIKQLVENIKKNLSWPDYKLFKPEIKESTLMSHLVSLNPQDNRKELFKGKTFFLPTEEQLENLKDIIMAAGGKTEILQFDNNYENLAAENVIVIQLPCNKIIEPDKNANLFKNMANILKNDYHLRIVPESEIFQAIAYASIEQYCNPRSLSFELRQSSNNHNSYGDIIQEETPITSSTNQCFLQCQREIEQEKLDSNYIRRYETSASPAISESDVSTERKRIGRKRAHSLEHEEEIKRFALEESVLQGTSSSKNKASDDFFRDPINVDHHVSRESSENSYEQRITKSCEDLKVTNDIDVSKNTDAINKNKQGLAWNRNTDYDLGNFWNDSEDKTQKTEPEKRKCSPCTLEKEEYGSSKKKKYLMIDSTNTKDIEPSIRNTDYKLSDISLGSKVISSNSYRAEPKFLNLDDSCTSWIRKKNYKDSDCYNELRNTDMKKFQKKKINKYEPPVAYPEEQLQQIGQSLVMNGWVRAQAFTLKGHSSSRTT